MAQILPSDILFLIFSDAAKTSEHSSDLPLDPLRLPPLNFSAVCRSWRVVALSEQSLWSTIDLCHTSNDCQPHSSAFRFISTWMKNSGSAPLTIRFKEHTPKDYSKSLPGHCIELLVLLLSEQHRCREVDICFGTTDVDYPFEKMTCSLGPFLTSLKFHVYLLHEDWPARRSRFDLTSCTSDSGAGKQLRELQLISCAEWLLPERRDTLSFPALRELHLHTGLDDGIDVTLDILSASPGVEMLDIFISNTCPGGRNRTLQLVDFTHLTEFRLETSPASGDCVFRLLDALSCPALQIFWLDHPQFITPPELDVLASFFTRGAPSSNPPLIDLYLNAKLDSDDDLDEDDVDPIPPTVYLQQAVSLANLLSRLNNLEKLDLIMLEINNDLIEKMMVKSCMEASNTGIICPALSFLTISNDGNINLREEMIEEMIESRSRKLRQLKFNFPGLKYVGMLKPEIGGGGEVLKWNKQRFDSWR